jgi:hypothetical protein
MSDNDFYTQSARQRLEQIAAERAAAEADLLAHRANSDTYSAGQSIQHLANLAAEQQNLTTLYNNYVQSQQPRQREYLTPEERAAKPIHKMDWSDAVDLARTSRYGKNIRADDPNMIAGWHESQRRRARGE